MGWLDARHSGCYPLRVNILKKIMLSSGSKLEKPYLVPIYIGTDECDRTVRRAKMIARARGETRTAFFLRALAREVLRWEAEVPGLLLDRDELEVLAMLSAQDKKWWGL